MLSLYRRVARTSKPMPGVRRPPRVVLPERRQGLDRLQKIAQGKLVPCGRRAGEKRRGYPACRPTLARCNGSKRKKRSSARISWKKKGGAKR